MSTNGEARNAEFSGRFDRVRAAMAEQGIDYLLIGPSTDMVYLIDFPVRQSERLTMLVISPDGPRASSCRGSSSRASQIYRSSSSR